MLQSTYAVLGKCIALQRYMKSSDAKASKCLLKFSSLMMIIKLVYVSSVISLKWQ